MDSLGVAVGNLGLSAPRPRARVEWRVGAVIAAQLSVAAAFAALWHAHHTAWFGAPWRVGAVAVAFAVTGAFDMTLELRRHNVTFTLADAVLVVALFIVGPVGVGVAAAVGETIDMLVQRHALLKAAFNVTNRLAAATVAGVAFGAVGRADTRDAMAWTAALAAALCFSLLDIVATSTVLAIVERTRFHDVLVRSVPTSALATLAAAPIGLVTLDLAHHGILTPLILVPLAIAVALNSRYAIAQRDEHLRFERLYESLARTAGISELEEALGALASEARSLGTASVGLCCAMGLDEVWLGVVADDRGRAAATSDATAAAIALADRMPGREVDVADAPELRRIAPGLTQAIVVSSMHENARRVVLVVGRDAPVSAAGKSRVETLETFAYQAALIVSNALLLEERAVALAKQIDLNRQKSDFVAAVSHELRTPLGVMLGSVHTLERLGSRVTDAQREQLFDMTLEQGGRLQRLIEELLLVAAAEHADVPVDENVFTANDLFESIAAGLNDAVRARLRLTCDTGEIVSDRSKLERILVNLVENAGKYAPDGLIELCSTHSEGHVQFAVVDHGSGIPAADRERVFERFVQLDQSSTRRQGGTGLGLHLCRQLTALVNGDLALGETPGGGCTFTLTIPNAQPPHAAPPPAPKAPIRFRQAVS